MSLNSLMFCSDELRRAKASFQTLTNNKCILQFLKNTFCVFPTSQLPLSVSLELDLFGHGGGRLRKAGGIIQQTNNRSAQPSFLIVMFSKHQHTSKPFCNSIQPHDKNLIICTLYMGGELHTVNQVNSYRFRKL